MVSRFSLPGNLSSNDKPLNTPGMLVLEMSSYEEFDIVWTHHCSTQKVELEVDKIKRATTTRIID